MSRHRIVRRMNYDEEYDGYDDVYGRSVEEDHCISPSTAEFMYDRNLQQPAMAAFMPRDDIPEEELEKEDWDDAIHYGKSDGWTSGEPGLNSIDEVRLQSCLDEMRNVVGDTFPEKTLVDAIIKHEFDLEKALDFVLSAAAPKNPPKPQRDRVGRRREGASRRSVQQPLVTSEPEPPPPVKDDVASVASTISTVTTFPSSTRAIAGFFPKEESEEKNVPVNTVVEKFDSLQICKDSAPCDEDTGNTVDVERLRAQSELGGVDAVIKEESASVSLKSVSRGRDLVSKIDPILEYQKNRGGGKNLINLVVVGHVDAGKSTLMGHLLCLVGAVSQKVLHKYEQESKKIGKASFMYAWVLDETGEERSRGVTMDVGHSKFETTNKIVTLLDAPGHKDFIPNMITGAAQADVAILVVDATRGEFETGFETGGQTREHALLVRSLGVSQIAVAVNKLDTVNWAEERYREIEKTLTHFLVKQAGFKDEDVLCIPCSGLTGENLTSVPCSGLLAQWYSGPTLLEQIDQFRPPERPVTKPFRLCIADVFKGQSSAFGVAGRVETGFVQAGEKVTVMPLGESVVVKSITLDDTPQMIAFAGDQVVISLSSIEMASVTIGCVLCDSTKPIRVCTRFRARIVVFNVEVPITKGFQAVLHYQSLSEPVVLRTIISQLCKGTGESTKKKPRCLTKQMNAIVELSTSRPICLEEYKEIREFGRFTLRSGGTSVAAGVVMEIL